MFQQLVLVGNVGDSPQMRYTTSGVPVTNFSVAVNERWTGADGEPQERTIWFRCTAWKRTAEIVAEHLAKGRQVMVVGTLQEPSIFTDRKGEPRASLDVNVTTVKFLGKKEDGAAGYVGPGLPGDSGETIEDAESIPF